MSAEELSLIAEMLAALKGVVRVADRATVEFDAARAAIAHAHAELSALSRASGEAVEVDIVRRTLAAAMITAAACEAPAWENFPPDQREAMSKETIYSLGHAAGVLSATEAIRKLRNVAAPTAPWMCLVPVSLLQNAVDALQRHLDRHAAMRVPVEDSDSDVVQTKLKAAIATAKGRAAT